MGKEHSEDDIRVKMLSYKVRITTRISGTDKNNFFLDTLKRGINESKLTQEIISLYYSIIKQNPHLKDKEFDEIKKYIIDKLS